MPTASRKTDAQPVKPKPDVPSGTDSDGFAGFTATRRVRPGSGVLSLTVSDWPR